jgi:hypothetical protein
MRRSINAATALWRRLVVDHKDGAVGYKRPPVATRFKPGQSGNPKGRKRGVRNFKTDVRLELDEIITVREGGREIKITKQRAFVKALVAAAIKGDMRATNALVSFCLKTFSDEEDRETTTSDDAEDAELLKEFISREAKRQAAGDGN